MSRMSDLDIEMQEMLERGISVEDVASFFDVPLDWVEQARANLLEQHYQDEINDAWYDEQFELND